MVIPMPAFSTKKLERKVDGATFQIDYFKKIDKNSRNLDKVGPCKSVKTIKINIMPASINVVRGSRGEPAIMRDRAITP